MHYKSGEREIVLAQRESFGFLTKSFVRLDLVIMVIPVIKVAKYKIRKEIIEFGELA